MPRRALTDHRPWLVASLIAGVSYFFVMHAAIPGLWLMLWKGAGVAFLAAYAWRRTRGFDGALITLAMALGAAGDMALEIDMVAGAACFVLGHVAAMVLYFRNRRPHLAPSQRLLSLLTVFIGIFIAALLAPIEQRTAVTLYAFFVAAMAASAWSSAFPRYRTGIGAMMFLASDLFIFARMGGHLPESVTGWLIWPLYYFGQFLIVTGVVGALRRGQA